MNTGLTVRCTFHFSTYRIIYIFIFFHCKAFIDYHTLCECLVLSCCFVLRTTMEMSPGLCVFIVNCISCLFIRVRHLFDKM